MRKSDVRIGMKVKVNKKSAGCSLDKSYELERAKEKGHDYLYVSGYDYEEKAWILSSTRYSKDSDGDPNGDFFLSSDFVRYNKKKS